MSRETWPKEWQRLRNGANGQVPVGSLQGNDYSGCLAMSRADIVARAIQEARSFVDRVHLLPRVCRTAVGELCGDSWGSDLIDHSPLFASVVAAVARLELNCVEHPEDVVIDLLNDCVEIGKGLSTWCKKGLARNMNPAAYLAALLDGSVTIFEADYAERCESLVMRQSDA
jgi:hypothetical protein